MLSECTTDYLYMYMLSECTTDYLCMYMLSECTSHYLCMHLLIMFFCTFKVLLYHKTLDLIKQTNLITFKWLLDLLLISQ